MPTVLGPCPIHHGLRVWFCLERTDKIVSGAIVNRLVKKKKIGLRLGEKGKKFKGDVDIGRPDQLRLERAHNIFVPSQLVENPSSQIARGRNISELRYARKCGTVAH